MLTIGIADKKVETKRIEKEQTCHGLQKINDIDDLLLQVYNNLDSHCLFYMPREELSNTFLTLFILASIMMLFARSR